MTKNWEKITAEIKYFWSKIAIMDVQATGEVFIPQKKTSSTSNLNFLHFFVGNFDPLGSGSGFVLPMRILIGNTVFTRLSFLFCLNRWSFLKCKLISLNKRAIEENRALREENQKLRAENAALKAKPRNFFARPVKEASKKRILGKHFLKLIFTAD
jgi:hypothetical protein